MRSRRTKARGYTPPLLVMKSRRKSSCSVGQLTSILCMMACSRRCARHSLPKYEGVRMILCYGKAGKSMFWAIRSSGEASRVNSAT